MATKEAHCAETAAPLARFPADIKPTFLGLRHQLGYIWRGTYRLSGRRAFFAWAHQVLPMMMMMKVARRMCVVVDDTYMYGLPLLLPGGVLEGQAAL